MNTRLTRRDLCGLVEKPILFSSEMVRAILDNRKTQTRRIVSTKNSDFGSANRSFFQHANFDQAWPDRGYLHVPCHRGDMKHLEELDKTLAARGETHDWREAHPDMSQCEECDRMGWTMTSHRLYPRFDIGDTLWVRETWAHIPQIGGPIYRADKPDGEPPNKKWDHVWKPSIHMPRWASRITLEVTDVRVERLQDISEEDAEAEGVDKKFVVAVKVGTAGWDGRIPNSYRGGFCCAWGEIHKELGTRWRDSPWVWAITFKRV